MPKRLKSTEQVQNSIVKKIRLREKTKGVTQINVLVGPAKVNKVKIFFRTLLHDQTCTNVRFRCSGVCFG